MKLFLIIFLLSFSFLCAEELTYYSQVGQDKYVNENLFKNRQEGFFVDIGAYDGITGSNSYFFEKNLNWKGICVEPIPELFEKLRNERKSINLNACVGERGMRPFLRIIGPDEMLSGLIDKYDVRHKELVDRIATQYGDRHEVIMVNCLPLMQILEENKITHVDYLSLDTEGGELEILKSIDYDKIDIEVIDVENNYQNPEFQKFLATKGYVLVTRLVIDEIYKKIR